LSWIKKVAGATGTRRTADLSQIKTDLSRWCESFHGVREPKGRTMKPVIGILAATAMAALASLSPAGALDQPLGQARLVVAQAAHQHGQQGASPGAQEHGAQQPKEGGMMSGGMMGGGMMQGGMMRGGMMGGMMQGGGMMPMMALGMSKHVEGTIAFLRAELKITDAQAPQFNAFADAMRANVPKMRSMNESMMAQAGAAKTVPERLAQHEKMLAERLDVVRAMKAALDPLYAALSDEQKKTADELIGGAHAQMSRM
jgi:hypothetical protein